MVSIASVAIDVLTVILSVGGSYYVATQQVEKQAKVRREKEREVWYRKSYTLALRAEDDWWKTMNSDEVSHEIALHEVLGGRKEEIEDHAAEGEAWSRDGKIVGQLEEAAAVLNAAQVKNPDYASLERQLLPVLDRIKRESKAVLGDDVPGDDEIEPKDGEPEEESEEDAA